MAGITASRIGGVCGLIIGLLFIAGGFWLRGLAQREQATLIETTGTIVDAVTHADRTDGNNTISYAPVIEILVNGDRTRFNGAYDTSRLSNGNVVVVRYDPKNVSASAHVVDAFEGLLPLAMFGMGGFAIITGLGELINVRRWFRRA